MSGKSAFNKVKTERQTGEGLSVWRAMCFFICTSWTLYFSCFVAAWLKDKANVLENAASSFGNWTESEAATAITLRSCSCLMNNGLIVCRWFSQHIKKNYSTVSDWALNVWVSTNTRIPRRSNIWYMKGSSALAHSFSFQSKSHRGHTAFVLGCLLLQIS